MKSARLIAMIALCVAVVVPLCGATDFEPDADGPWVVVDTVDLALYGDATYLDYLGMGYVPLLEAVKAEGLIIDYGVTMKVTGAAGKGDVVIWWTLKSIADYEKVGARMSEMSAEMHSDAEWAEIWKKLEEVRKLRSTEFYRNVIWTEKTDE